jgi:membrane-associated phospholipid phosphatase
VSELISTVRGPIAIPASSSSRDNAKAGLQNACYCNRRLVWLACVVAGIVSTVLVLFGLDASLQPLLAGGELPGDLRRAIMLSEAFAHGSGVIVILLVLLSVQPDRWRRTAVVAACALGSGVAADLVKTIVHRLRPTAMPAEISDPWGSFVGVGFSTVTETWAENSHQLQSFPSAHTATAVGLAIGLSWCYGRGWIAFALLAVLAGTQRIVVGAHWPSDVLAGATLAIIVAPAFLLISRRWVAAAPGPAAEQATTSD